MPDKPPKPTVDIKLPQQIKVIVTGSQHITSPNPNVIIVRGEEVK